MQLKLCRFCQVHVIHHKIIAKAFKSKSLRKKQNPNKCEVECTFLDLKNPNRPTLNFAKLFLGKRCILPSSFPYYM